MLIGISGKKFVGKDTVATLLTQWVSKRRGTVLMAAFADPLKEVAANISGIPLHWFYTPALKEVIHPCCGRSPRMVMEGANSCFKQQFGDDVFVRSVARKYENSGEYVFIATDVRFEVESDWVRYCGGTMIHVLRETGHVSTAKSEQGVPVLLGDHVIHNGGGLGALRERVDVLAKSLFPDVKMFDKD